MTRKPWENCKHHGPAEPNVWACPTCLVELRTENGRLRDLSESRMQRNESLRRILTEIYMGRWRDAELPQDLREAVGRALLPGRAE